jgi:hypothetical protein
MGRQAKIIEVDSCILSPEIPPHKLCRACYYIMRDGVAFDLTKAFGTK